MGHNRVLVGVLSAGEPSLESSLASIHAQEKVEVEIIHVADRLQFEAHRELFATFDERSADFDLIVKIDADMEILNPRLLTALIAMFQRFPEHDLIPVAVDDWLSGTRISGAKRRPAACSARSPSPRPAMVSATGASTSHQPGLTRSESEGGRPVIEPAGPTSRARAREGNALRRWRRLW